MLKSMTGYGRERQILNGRDISVEIRSVNHRFFEFNPRLPRVYGYIEEPLKAMLSKSISRGKIDVNVTVYTVDGKTADVKINRELAQSYITALRSVAEELSLRDDLSLSSVTRFSDVFNVSSIEADEAAVTDDVMEVAQSAAAGFVKMREAEGEKLEQDISGRLETILNSVKIVEELSPKSVQTYVQRLTAKINEVLDGRGADEARIVTEAAIFADKVAVDEETVRLRSHIKQFKTLIKAIEPVGKKLDFLVQEMNREVNTIGSKCQDAEITTVVVGMKSEIEKIREQIQNIE